MSAASSDKEWLENAEQAESTNSHASEYPTHPLSQLQGPFEESITESADPKYLQWQVFIDTQSRRDQILTSPKYERLCGRRWRQRPGERYHPLWKIVAQISFGLHLLANDLAKSEIHVVKILQTHVSDIDGFIERTTDDLQLALNDITERFDLLRLPLENSSIFSEMLEDPTFRQSVIIDNERIEHIITRSTLAMDDSLKDIRKGNESVNGLAFYIKEVGKEWVDRPPELDPICEAMVGNVDGWNRELRRLKRSVHKLAIALTQMTRYSLEIQRLVGVASRKGVVSPRPIPRKQPRLRFRMSTVRGGSPTVLEKPLPHYPQISDPPVPESRPSSIITKSDHPIIQFPTTTLSLPLRERAVPNESENQQDPESATIKTNGLSSAFKQPDAFTIPRKPIPRQSPPTLDLLKNDHLPDVEEEHDNFEDIVQSSEPPSNSYVLLKNPIKSSSRIRTQPSRLYRSASKTFSVISNMRNAIKGDNQAKTDPLKSPNLSERSWIDFEPIENKMSWAPDSEDTNAFESKSDVSPEFPHLGFLTISEGESSSDDEDPEDSTDLETNSDEESQVTALPSLGSVSINHDTPASWYDDTAAEVASLYSVRSRKRKKRESHKPPPLPIQSFSAFKTPDYGDGESTINHSRSWLGLQTPFSLRSKEGSEAPESPSADTFKSVDTHKAQTNWISSTKSTASFSLFPPSIRSPSTVNGFTQTPPISPRTLHNPMSSAQSTRPGTASGGVSSRGYTYLSAPTSPSFFSFSEKELVRESGNKEPTVVQVEAEKPTRGPVAKFKPRLKKFASTTSLTRSFQNANISQFKVGPRSNTMIPADFTESKRR